MTSLASAVNHSLAEYPTLYGRSKLRVYNQFFFVNGNGLAWENGCLIPSYKTPSQSKENSQAWKIVWETLKATPKDPKHFPKFTEEENANSLKARDFNFELTAQGIVRTICSAPSYYELSLTQFSKIATIPDNIQKDWLEGAVTSLLHCLTIPSSHQAEDNHARALIHLTRLTKRFGTEILPKDKTNFWEILPQAQQKSLQLDCKRHITNYETDDSKLSDPEYFQYYHLDPNGFSPPERSLIRQHHTYLRWKEAQAKQTHKDTGKKEKELLTHLLTKGSLKNKTFTCPIPSSLRPFLQKEMTIKTLLLRISSNRDS
jgi:hypothetical protein